MYSAVLFKGLQDQSPSFFFFSWSLSSCAVGFRSSITKPVSDFCNGSYFLHQSLCAVTTYRLRKSSCSMVWRMHPCSCRFKLRNDFPVFSSLFWKHVKLAIQERGSWTSSAAGPGTDAPAHCPQCSSPGTSLWPLKQFRGCSLGCERTLDVLEPCGLLSNVNSCL